MALLKKKVPTVPHKVTLDIEKPLADRLKKIEEMAEKHGFEFDMNSGLIDSLVMQVTRAEKVLQKALNGQPVEMRESGQLS